jgi:hypothetical protein
MEIEGSTKLAPPGGLFPLRGLHGTFVPALSSMLIVKRRLWICSREIIGRSEMDLERKKGHERQAFMDSAWRHPSG